MELKERSELLVSILVPVFNEVATVERLLERVREVPIRKEIIVVDDGSTDGTREVLARLQHAQRQCGDDRLEVLFHSRNQGKGAAVRSAIERIRGDVIVVTWTPAYHRRRTRICKLYDPATNRWCDFNLQPTT